MHFEIVADKQVNEVNFHSMTTRVHLNAINTHKNEIKNSLSQIGKCNKCLYCIQTQNFKNFLSIKIQS